MSANKNSGDGRDLGEFSWQFRCPACKNPLRLVGNGSLLCTHCHGNSVSERFEQSTKEMSEAHQLCEEVIFRMAGGPSQKELAGLVRVCLHWYHRLVPEVFSMTQSAGVSREVIRQHLARHVQTNLVENPIFCCHCDTMLVDSDPDSPLECIACGGQNVEPRSMTLALIAQMANRGKAIG